MLLQMIDGVAPSVARASEGVASSPAPVAAVAPAVEAPPVHPTPDAVRIAVDNANRDLQSFTRALQFEVDPDTHQVVVRLIDTQEQRVLRQVPSQEMLEIARALARMQTLLVRGEA